MDSSPSPSTSSRHKNRSRSRSRDRDRERHRHKKRKHKKKRSRSRTRTRSRSSSYSPDRKRLSVVYRSGKTASEYELRIQALSTQLAMANSQLVTTETALESAKKDRTRAENKLFFTQQEKDGLEKRNAEIVQIMKTLEGGVQALQKEKEDMAVENATLKEKAESASKNLDLLNEQITSLNERNVVLSKKCVDLLEAGKDNREKCAGFQQEIEFLKPHIEKLQKEVLDLMEENKQKLAQIAIFETREQNWIKIKHELEFRVKEMAEKAERAERYVHQRLAASIDDSFKKMVKGEHMYIEQLKKLQLALDSIRAHHHAKSAQTASKLESLERFVQEHQRMNNNNDAGGGVPESSGGTAKNHNQHQQCVNNNNAEDINNRRQGKDNSTAKKPSGEGGICNSVIVGEALKKAPPLNSAAVHKA